MKRLNPTFDEYRDDLVHQIGDNEFVAGILYCSLPAWADDWRRLFRKRDTTAYVPWPEYLLYRLDEKIMETITMNYGAPVAQYLITGGREL